MIQNHGSKRAALQAEKKREESERQREEDEDGGRGGGGGGGERRRRRRRRKRSDDVEVRVRWIFRGEKLDEYDIVCVGMCVLISL